MVVWHCWLGQKHDSDDNSELLQRIRAPRCLSCALQTPVPTGFDDLSLIYTLAYQLGSFDPQIGIAVSSAISRHHALHNLRSIFNSRDSSLSLPPREDLCLQRPIAIILDVIDKCGTVDSRKFLSLVILKSFRVSCASSSKVRLRSPFLPTSIQKEGHSERH